MIDEVEESVVGGQVIRRKRTLAYGIYVLLDTNIIIAFINQSFKNIHTIYDLQFVAKGSSIESIICCKICSY